MKQRLFNWFKSYFAKELVNESVLNYETQKQLQYQKGYNEAKAHFDALVEQRAQTKYSNQNWLVDPLNVLMFSTTGKVFLNNEQIPKKLAENLKTEAVYLRSSSLWSLLQETLKQKAIEKAVINSVNFEQVLAGKLMIHNLGIIKTLVDRIAELKTEEIMDVVVPG